MSQDAKKSPCKDSTKSDFDQILEYFKILAEIDASPPLAKSENNKESVKK